MASELDRSIHHGAKSKLLKMDVIEMTLLLKSIGFRLNSIDYDDHGSNIMPKLNENACDNQTDFDMSSHSISVRITCSKSKMVSNLSYKYTEITDNKVTPCKQMVSACTCPKREICNNNNNSFWEVQSSGTFANTRKSVGSLALTPDTNTFSNLLPDLPTKSIALTQVLIQVLLNQYQHNAHNGEFSVKEVDIKGIMKAFENSNSFGSMTRKSIGGNNVVTNKENLDPAIPKHVSNTNVELPVNENAIAEPPLANTPPKLHLNGDVISDDFGARNNVLNETVNTEAFSSPKSDIVTSSPNHNDQSGQIFERDATIINNLNEARNYIDRALLVMKLNVTRNLSHDITSTLLTVTPDMENERRRQRLSHGVEPMQMSQPSSRQSSASTTPSTRLARRASIGGPIASVAKINSTSASRNGSPKATGIAERRASLSKLSLVRRAVSGLGGNRSINGSNQTTSSSASKLPSIQATSKVNMKAPRTSSLSTSITRRIIPNVRPLSTNSSATATNSSGLASVARKSTLSARPITQASKLPKK